MKRSTLLAVIVLLSGSALAAESDLVGAWYGIGQPYDPTAMWLQRYFPDGTFEIKVVSCTGTRAKVDAATGRWSLEGSREILHLDMENGRPIQKEDTYDIVLSAGSSLRETMVASSYVPSFIGLVWNSSKVPDDFQLPGCDAIS